MRYPQNDEASPTKNSHIVELTIHDHCGRETQFTLHKLPISIGRDSGADVQLIDPWASQIHCEIDQIDDVVVVRDLASKNGIFMHGRRVRESQVVSGDRLTIGRTGVTVRYAVKEQTAIEIEASEPQKQRPSQNNGPETIELSY